MSYIFLSCAVFCIGLLGVLSRKNLIVMLMSVELMLSSANILLVYFSSTGLGAEGQAAVLLLFVVAAAEAAVGLSIIVSIFKLKGNVDVDGLKELKN
jgi:NADH-quinone oxidoreductase subunit K